MRHTTIIDEIHEKGRTREDHYFIERLESDSDGFDMAQGSRYTLKIVTYQRFPTEKAVRQALYESLSPQPLRPKPKKKAQKKANPNPDMPSMVDASDIFDLHAIEILK